MDILPGSWIEKKRHAIAFHFREVPDEYLKNRIKNIRNSLNYLIYKHNLQIINGNKVIEILERENRIKLYNDCLKFLKTRVDLDLALFKDDIWSH